MQRFIAQRRHDLLNMTGAPHQQPTAAGYRRSCNPSTTGAGNLTGTYQYYVTFSNRQRTGKPAAPLADHLADVDQQPGHALEPSDAPTRASGRRRRSIAARTDTPGDTNFYEIADVPIATATQNGYTFIDNYTDADPAGRSPAGDTSAAGSNLELQRSARHQHHLAQNVVEYNASTGTTRQRLSHHGHFEFHGNRGRHYADHADLRRHRTLDRSRTWRISCKARWASSRPQATIRTIRFPSIRLRPGGRRDHHSDGQIQIVGNDGTANAVSIGLSAMQLTSGGPPTPAP